MLFHKKNPIIQHRKECVIFPGKQKKNFISRELIKVKQTINHGKLTIRQVL